MHTRTSPKRNYAKTKSSARKPIRRTGRSKLRVLEEQLAQRDTELQIINNIGQTLTEGLDLNSTIERVGERLRDVLKLDSLSNGLAIAAFDPKSDLVIAQYIRHKGERIATNLLTTEKSKFGIRFAARWADRGDERR